MCELNRRLVALVQQVCHHAPRSEARQRSLTQLIRLITQSGQLWRDPSLGYEDALQQTWLYVCQNLCESTTAQPYDPELSSLLTWINNYLRGQLQLYQQRRRREQHRYHSIDALDTSYPLDELLTDVPPPEATLLLVALKDWLNDDPSGELSRTHLKEYPKVSCQLLIQRRLQDGASWEELSQELGISISTLSSFYERQCRPRLIRFAHTHGYP